MMDNSPNTNTTNTNTVLEWTARIRCKQYELESSFAVVLFLGQIPDDPKQWLTTDAFVGAFNTFVNDAPGECENCQAQADLAIEGFVHLNAAISKQTREDSFEPDSIVPYLTNSLLWGVRKVKSHSSRELHNTSTHKS
jgi:tyrosinase